MMPVQSQVMCGGVCVKMYVWGVCVGVFLYFFDLFLSVLQYLNGAQLLFIVNPFIFFVKQVFLLKRRGKLNSFPSFLLHVLDLLLATQQLRGRVVRLRVVGALLGAGVVGALLRLGAVPRAGAYGA